MSSLYQYKYLFVLRTCYGRDLLLKTLPDLSRLLTICISPKHIGKLDNFKNQILDCISVLNFFDLTALRVLLRICNWKEAELEIYEAYCIFIYNVAFMCTQMTNQVIWAGKHNILPININKWILFEAYFSIVSSSMNVLLYFKKSNIMQNMIYKAKKEMKGMEDTENKKNIVNLLNEQEISKDEAFETYQIDTLNQWNHSVKQSTLICIYSALRTIYFINYLPKGILWGGRLSTWQLGALGVVSSLIHFYQSLEYVRNMLAEIQ